MKFVFVPAIILALAGASSAALAANKENKDGRICRMEVTVGSHMPKRVCSTQAERDAVRKQSQEKIGNLKQQGRIGSTRTGAN